MAPEGVQAGAQLPDIVRAPHRLSCLGLTLQLKNDLYPSADRCPLKRESELRARELWTQPRAGQKQSAGLWEAVSC